MNVFRTDLYLLSHALIEIGNKENPKVVEFSRGQNVKHLEAKEEACPFCIGKCTNISPNSGLVHSIIFKFKDIVFF